MIINLLKTKRRLLYF